MSGQKWREREIERRLREVPAPVPPSDLLARLKAEIPTELEVGPRSLDREATAPVSQPSRPSGHRWLLAASLVAVVGAGVLGVRVMDEAGKPGARAGAARQDAPEMGERDEIPGWPTDAMDTAEAPEAAPSAASRPAPQAGAVEEKLAEVPATEAPVPLADQAAGPRQDLRMSREEAARPRQLPPPPPPPPPPPAPAAPEPTLAGGDTRRLPAAAPPPPAKAEERDARTAELLRRGEGAAGGVVGGVVGGAVGSAEDVEAESVVYRDEITVTTKANQPRRQQVASSTAARRKERASALARLGEPANGGFVRSHGVNPFVDTGDDRLSTFGLAVDTASYTLARRYLDDGRLPPPEAVRIEEHVNAFRYGDPAPAAGDFAIRVEGAPTPFVEGESYRLLRVGVRGREVSTEHRKPAVLTFVVDASDSMRREGRLDLVKRALGLLLAELRESDRVGLVVYGTVGRVVLEHTSDHAAIRQAIERLAPEGSTNVGEGLRLGYALAGRGFREGAANRVVLCSDGVANVSADPILERIGHEARRGIELTAVGVGMGDYDDVLMERMATRGNGRYAYVDSLDEARRIFVEELTGTLQTIAVDAKAQVEWNPEAVTRYRLLGYENRDVADERFRDDAVDAGEIGAGHTVTALYEVKLQPQASKGDALATVRLRWRSPESQRVSEVERRVTAADLAPSWDSASPSLKLAAVAAEQAELLKRSYWAKGGSFEEVARRARALVSAFPNDDRVRDLAQLAERAARIARERQGE